MAFGRVRERQHYRGMTQCPFSFSIFFFLGWDTCMAGAGWLWFRHLQSLQVFRRLLPIRNGGMALDWHSDRRYNYGVSVLCFWIDCRKVSEP